MEASLGALIANLSRLAGKVGSRKIRVTRPSYSVVRSRAHYSVEIEATKLSTASLTPILATHRAHDPLSAAASSIMSCTPTICCVCVGLGATMRYNCCGLIR